MMKHTTKQDKIQPPPQNSRHLPDRRIWILAKHLQILPHHWAERRVDTRSLHPPRSAQTIAVLERILDLQIPIQPEQEGKSFRNYPRWSICQENGWFMRQVRSNRREV